MTTTPETFEFQTEARQLLDLMVHSVYSHKDIFLRELVSNASDALDKLRFEALTREDLTRFTSDPLILITADKGARTLSVADNGIGMGRDEIMQFLGTIARSGTREYLKAAREAKDSQLPPELIGQFGVGFYSSFMVADRVTVVTRRAGDEHAWRWESAGDGSFTIAEDSRFEPGTTVTLHLKPADSEDALEDYTDATVIRGIVRKYSDFVAYPIRLRVEEPGKADDQKLAVEDAAVNSMKAIWTRPEKEVEESEYNEFYRHISHDWEEPLKRVLMRAEGTSEFRALLYIPSRARWDILMPTGDRGIQLYIRRVFIMSDCKELIPEWLRFLRGVVDSEDLSLNISREILQKNRQIQLIRKAVVKKVLGTLSEMHASEKEKFADFWREFGRVVKEGIVQDPPNRDAVLELSVFPTTAQESGPTTLDEYVGRMKEGQERIYYATGDSLAAAANSPHLEAFKAKGYEVLLLADPVDQVWVDTVPEFKGKRFQSVGRGDAGIGTFEERKEAEKELKERAGELKPLLEALAKALGDSVKEVRVSGRLTESPACLVADANAPSPQLEAMLRAMGQEVPAMPRILEVNPGNPVVERLRAIAEENSDDPRLAEGAELLLGQAVLAEGGQLPDPAAFSKRLAQLMARAL
jgi:molecular chaperone HtpG